MGEGQGLQIFHLQQAPLLEETDLQPITSELTEGELELWGRKIEAGHSEGQEVRVAVQLPGLSVLHIWNKKGFPTPLHSHDVDCLYVVLAGSASIGGETLGPGDSFFIPADMPYTYKVGPEGAEVIEIRQADNWDLKLFARNRAYFDKAVAAITANREGWQSARRPSEKV